MIRHNECPVCSGGKIFYFLNCKDYLVSREAFEIYKCANCSFIFTQNYPEEKEMHRFYDSEEYISHSNTDKGIINRIYRSTRGFMLQKKKKIIKKSFGFTAGHLLDIGAGTGHFLNTMSKAGWKVTGIEINDKAREYAITRFGLDLIPPENIKILPDKSIDCITLWHVLEHIQDPNKYFREIKRLLKPGGIVIVALPNINSFDAEYYREHWAALDVPRHLWHFNPSTFKIFAEKNGFRTAEIYNLPLDVFYISILSERIKDSRLPFLRGMVRGMIFSIRTISNKTRSSSIIYIIRKESDQ